MEDRTCSYCFLSPLSAWKNLGPERRPLEGGYRPFPASIASAGLILRWNKTPDSHTSSVVVDNNGTGSFLSFGADKDKIWDGFSTENTDIRGIISVSAATSASVTFPQAYSHAPACIIAPSSDPAGIDWWVTTSTTAVTANLSASGTVSFFYICIGANN